MTNLKENTQNLKITPDYQINKEHYAPLINDSLTNQLTAIYSPKEPVFPAFEPYIKYPNGLTLIYDPDQHIILTGSTDNLMDALMLKLTGQIDHKQEEPYTTEQTMVKLSLREYAKSIGKDPNNKETLKNIRKQVVKDLDSLFYLSLRKEWNEKTQKQKYETDFFETRILIKRGIKNSIIYACFDTDFIKSITRHGGITNYPLNLLKLPTDKTPLYRVIGKKLAIHHSFYNNIKNHTNNIISMKSLIKWATDYGALQSEEQLKAKGQRNFYRLIIDPIENALEKLIDHQIITEWNYTNAKGKYLTDTERNNLNYETAKEKYVYFRMPYEPKIKETKGGLKTTKKPLK